MPRIVIDDLDDPRLALYRSLKTTNLTRRSDLFVVEGLKLVERLALSRFPLVSIVVTDRVEARIEARLPREAPRFVVAHSRIEELVGFNFHQGVLGAGQRLPWPDWGELSTRSEGSILLIICPRLDNPENLGSIARIADAFGADAVLVGDRCPDPLSRRVLRVSMGSSLRIPAIAVPNLEQAIGPIQAKFGVELWAATAGDDAESVQTVQAPQRLALVLGSESSGLDAGWVARCDRRVSIPMREGVDSLNVAVAAGILLHRIAESRG
jgi:tRNA G18 (ribose-2'-O)-methylase SpoU